jgi:hypothetical protein
MTSLLNLSFAQTGISCKTGLGQMATAIRPSRDVHAVSRVAAFKKLH